MSQVYRAVGWNPQKRAYDAVALAGVLATVATVGSVTLALNPSVTVETVILRSFGVTAFLLLHVILSIGPLCRLDARFLPLLYNRRHLGVTMFVLAATHGVLAIVQFHGGGDRNPLVSVLTSSQGWLSTARFPFHVPGVLALLILLAMAATSHDFWLRTLTPPVWKTLHMGVYVAYASLIVHVMLGVVQSDVPPGIGAGVGMGVAWMAVLHTLAAARETRRDRPADPQTDALFVDVCHVDDIPERRARIACLGGERVAIFRYDGKISAVSNVCQHQNGPLGEGKIVGGCIVCPWHGFEYSPDTGAAPPPFTEAVPTFRLSIRDSRVLVDPRPLPPGTRVEPAVIESKDTKGTRGTQGTTGTKVAALSSAP